MPVTLLCPNLKCRMVLSVPEETRGKKVRCKYCGMTFIVPEKVVVKAKKNDTAPTS
jgi:DNA-directed RNA polymerase subunit RPC12/RpoP